MLLLINVLLTSWFYTAHGQVKPCNYPVIKHGRLYYSYRGYFPARVNQQFSYYCDQYFVPPSQYSWDYLTCTAEGWSPEEPCLRECIFKNLENGQTPSSEKKVLQGETISVRCDHGYSLENNQNTMICTENGWSPPPRCIRVNPQGKCGPPPPIDNGDITSLLQLVYPPGMIVEYRCQAYYELRGNRNVVCRSGEWSEPPKCLEACVISEETMRKHHIQLRWKIDTKLYSKTEDNIEFTCQRGYRPVTPHHTFRTTCREGKMVYPSCG
ncbi:complement factor H isoform X7 [Cervus canadensis]|uniref:complement factor H isoform X7 n=1 Tax=Cervus canadensis TaxID=1574408 RepID=UPI001C9E3E31|nr:complement factor H isoform X7 [Cervus canadensis]